MTILSLVGLPGAGKTTVGKLLGKDGSVRAFTRYEVGEGIEKKEVNFAEEVIAQARGADG